MSEIRRGEPGAAEAEPGFAEAQFGSAGALTGFAGAEPGFTEAEPGFAGAQPGAVWACAMDHLSVPCPVATESVAARPLTYCNQTRRRRFRSATGEIRRGEQSAPAAIALTALTHSRTVQAKA